MSRIPSMKITDLATAIDAKYKQEVVGIRPGEKIHEILISEDEARNTVVLKECFVVQAQSVAKMTDALDISIPSISESVAHFIVTVN